MSGRKNILKQFNTIASGSMAGNLTSAVTNINFLDDVGYQFNWTGSPTGTFSIQVSADYNQDNNGNVLNTGNWVPLVLTYWNGSVFVTGTTIPTSVGSSVYVDLALLSAPWIRTVYTAGASTGTLNAWVTAKMVG